MDDVKEIVTDRILDELLNSKLSEQEQKFILYYLESYNATQSYLKAFGGRKENARIYAFILLHRSDIKSELKKLKKLLKIAYDIDPTQYLEFLFKAANADIGDYIKFSEEEVPQYNDDGSPVVDIDTGEPITKKVNRMHLVDSNDVDTSVITSIKQGRDGITIQLVDKLKCWEKIREFFEWKLKKEEETKAESNIMNALSESVKSTWEDEDVYNDLDETLKDEK